MISITFISLVIEQGIMSTLRTFGDRKENTASSGGETKRDKPRLRKMSTPFNLKKKTEGWVRDDSPARI